MTITQFLKLPQKRIELLDGVPVGMPPRFLRESLAVSALSFPISSWVRERKLGLTTFGCLFQTAPDRVRMPALSFLSHDDLRGENLNWIISKAPTWCAEVDAPGIEEKVGEWLRCGTREVWVLDVATRSVHVHQPSGTRTFGPEQILQGSDVFLGFELSLHQIWEH